MQTSTHETRAAHRQGARLCRTLMMATGFTLAASATPAFAQTALPVFSLESPKVDEQKLLEVARAVDPKAQFEVDKGARSGVVAYRAGQVVADGELRSGSLFVADLGQIWNGQAKPVVPSASESRTIAERFFRDLKLIPAANKHVRFAYLGDSETGGGEDAGDKIDKLVISRHFTYAAQVLAVDGTTGAQYTLPVVGGGGDVRVSVGDAGRVVGFSGGFRAIEGVIDVVPITTRAAILGGYTKQLESQDLKPVSLSAKLAYYAAPGFQAQKLLTPVWVVDGSIQVGTQQVPLRTQILAATQYGPVFDHGKPAPKRDPGQLPPPGDGDESGVKTSFLDWFVPRAHAASGLECGASWIGTSGGLSGSAGNRQGFLNRCANAGWNINFDWGDAWAFESDWNRNDDLWVDAADLVFYTGHADANTWMLRTPDDGSLHYTEIAGAADRYGKQDLEWFIVAACGPFESNHFVSGVGNAFDRWRPLFDGMHVALGYGAVTYDNEEEGDRFMELSQSGWTVIDAWFRAAQEIQPTNNSSAAPYGPKIYVVAMYAHNGNHCARNDHLHGEGSVCSDVPAGAGQQRYMMWSGT